MPLTIDHRKGGVNTTTTPSGAMIYDNEQGENDFNTLKDPHEPPNNVVAVVKDTDGSTYIVRPSDKFTLKNTRNKLRKQYGS